MSKKNLLKLSLFSLIIGVVFCLITYFMFHYVTDDGISSVKLDEAGKPLVTNMIATFAVLFLFLSASSLLVSLIFYKKND